LIEAGADVNAQAVMRYGNALQAAVSNYEPDKDIAKLLIKAGADVNAQGGEYGTALRATSRKGQEDIVEILLRAGALWILAASQRNNEEDLLVEKGSQKRQQL
jgi:ankyrin repeat protein